MKKTKNKKTEMLKGLVLFHTKPIGLGNVSEVTYF